MILVRTYSADANNQSAAEALTQLPEWDLCDLYSGLDSEVLRTDLESCGQKAVSFEARFKGQLVTLLKNTDGGDRLAGAVRAFEELQELLGKIMSYAGLIYAGNSSDPARAKFYGDAQETVTAASSHLLFFPLELNRLDDLTLNQAMDESDALAHYRPWLADIRLDKPYQLDDQIERLFLEKSTSGHSAFNRLFDETLSGLRFDIDGEELTLEPALNLLQHAEEESRRKASIALADVFDENLRLFTLVTNTLAKDKEISDRWRGFEDVADSRHLANRVERPVVDALVRSVTDAFPRLSHRYYAMKAGWLGMDALNHWDRNAPLPEVSKDIIEWPDARQIVLCAYRDFAPEMSDIAARFFDNYWIDASVRSGKSPGAFSHPVVPSVHPYILMNYQGKPRDVMTLAHELGHGVHQVLAGSQGALMSQTPLTLAETASVFGEMLTFRSLLDQTHEASKRKALLCSKVEDMLNTVVRQIAFYMFERRVHTERRKGELTANRLGEIWLDVQKQSLGPAIRLGPGYETFWTYIPHFIHSPFYVYAYAFGDCLVNSLYAVYQDTQSGFQEKYFEMLKAGGSKHHSELLAPFGLDATDPAFWQKGLSVIAAMIDEIEVLEQTS